MENGKDQKFLERIFRAHKANTLIFNRPKKDKATGAILEIKQIEKLMVDFFREDEDDDDNLMECIVTLNNVIRFCDNSSSTYKGFYNSYWESVDLENPRDITPLLKDLKLLLTEFEKHIKPILFLGGRNDILEELKERQGTLSPYLNKIGMLSQSNNTGHLFSSILKFRNGYIHQNSTPEEDLAYGQYQIPAEPTPTYLKQMILLCSCGLLIIVNKYKANIDKYLEDHKDEWMVTEQENAVAANTFDFNSFINGYVNSLNEYCKARMEEKVGHYGGLSNASGLLMTLYLKKENSSFVEWDDEESDDEASEDKEKDVIIPMEDLSGLKERTCFILGNPGAGKTTVLLNMILEHCDEYSDNREKERPIPVLLKLNEIRGENLNIDKHIANAVQDIHMFADANQEAILNELRTRKVIYYIDGINEAHIDKRESFMKNLKDFANGMKNCRFYITGRIYEFASYRKIFSSLDNSAIFEIQEIGDRQRHDFLQQLGMTPENITDFKNKIEVSDVQDLLGSPLNFYLIAKSFILNESSISFSNRGELLDSVMGKILGDNFKGGDMSTGEFVERSKGLLQHIAISMFNSRKPAYINEEDIVQDRSNVRALLVTLHEMNILERRERFGIYEIRFFVDTYYEYYLALGLIRKFLDEGCDIEKTGIDFRDKDMKETLKLIIEIISNKNNSKSSSRKVLEIERAFISGILENGKKDTPEEFNEHIELLCNMVAGLKSNNDSTNPNARQMVESLVLNYLVYYRCTHPVETEDNEEYLAKLFGYAAALSGNRILNEIFSLYWLSNLGITDASELKVKGVSSLNATYQVRRAVIEGKNICAVYDGLQKVWSDLSIIWPKSAQNLKNFIFSIFMGAEDKSKKKLYAHILKQAEKKEDPIRKKLLLTDANMLLLFINDMDFVEKFNAEEFNLQIYWHPVKALMRLHEDSRLAEFVFSDVFISKLSYPGQILLYMIRFHLFRGLIPEALKGLIFGAEPKILKHKYITEDEYRALLDIIPANRIPQDIVKRYYNPEIHEFVVNKMGNDLEESYSSLIYSHFHSDKESITISIKNIRSDFTDTYAIFNIDGKPYEHRIIEDRWQLARKTTLLISSLDGSIIPASGTMTAAGGEEYEYMAFTPGSTINVTVYDEAMASRLMGKSGQENTLTLNGISCSFSAKSEEFNRYRTLRIEKRSDVTLTESTGEVMFAQKRKNSLLPVQIDKQTREEEERHNRDNFRVLPARKNGNASALPYYVIGIHDNSAWIACDPLKEANPFDNKKALLSESTGLGAAYTGKVHKNGYYGQRIVELTFRCRLKPNIAKTGKIAVTYSDGEKEKYNYIYSFTSHKTVTLRFREDVFAGSSVLEKLIRSGKRQEIQFKVSCFDMYLESAEILDTKEVYCLGIIIDKCEHAKIPAAGLIRRTDKEKIAIQESSWTKTAEIKGIATCDISPETDSASFFLADDSIKDACCHYICIDGSPLHLKIKGQPARLQWTARMVLPLDINWPASKGAMRFEGLDGCMFRFTHLSEDEIRFWPTEGKISFKEFSRFMETAETVEIQTGGQIYSCCIQSHDAPEEENSKAYILCTDFPSDDRDDIKAWSVHETDRVMLASRIVINNRMTKVNIIDFKPKTVTYSRKGQEMQIVKPSTPLKKEDIWIEVDRGMKFKVEKVTEAKDGRNYIRLQLRDQRGYAPNLKDKGEIRFFSRDKDGFKETKIGYQNIFSLIDWQNPHKYHADICSILEYELIESGIEINDTVRTFFKEKSRSYSLVSNPILFNKVKSALQKKNNHEMVFDVCKVVSSANDTQLSAISFMQKGMVTTSDTGGIYKYRQGDYILYEKNHKIHYLENPPRHPALGFIRGTSITRLNDGNCFVRADGTSTDFYCAAGLELGDTVQFFASYNMIDKDSPNRNLAIDIVKDKKTEN